MHLQKYTVCVCVVCSWNKVETELHFMITCPNYSRIAHVKHVCSLQPATKLISCNIIRSNSYTCKMKLQKVQIWLQGRWGLAVREGQPLLVCILHYCIYIIVFSGVSFFIGISFFVMPIKLFEPEKTII